jgi:AraC-like DNA-binding protein
MSVPVLDIHKLPAYTIDTIAWHGSDLAAYNTYSAPAVTELYIPQHCISMVVKGDKTMHTQYGSYHMSTGDMLFLPAGTYLFSDIHWLQQQYESAVVLLPHDLLANLYKKQLRYSTGNEVMSTQLHPQHFSANSFLQDWMHSFRHYFSMTRGKHFDLMLEAKIHELLLYLQQMDRSGIIAHIIASANSKSGIAGVIERHFRYKLKIDALADMAGMSLSTFKRECYRLYGRAPGEILFEKKMQLARLYLLQTNKSIAEIAEDVGYATSSHFSQAFQKHFNTTPQQARSQKRHLLN